jgi:TRAP-type C4-dicarboxylate transport system permease small subunit
MGNRFFKALIGFFEWLCTAVLGLILVMVFIQIMFRDLLKISAPWTEEISRYLLVTMVYLGAVVVFYRRTHVTLAILDRLGPRLTRAIDVLGDLVVVICIVVLLVGSIKMTRMNWRIPSITIPYVPIGIIYLISSIGAVAGLVVALARIVFTVACREE